MEAENLRKVKTTSLNSKFTGCYKEVYLLYFLKKEDTYLHIKIKNIFLTKRLHSKN